MKGVADAGLVCFQLKAFRSTQLEATDNHISFARERKCPTRLGLRPKTMGLVALMNW
jgi:hypothetical protein